MLLIKELLETRKVKVPFPFEKEWKALRARSGRPGKKTSLSDEEVDRLKMIETIWGSQIDDDHRDEDEKLSPKSGPALWSDIPERSVTSLICRKGRIYIGRDDLIRKKVQDISTMYKGDDAEVAKKLRKSQLDIERSYPDTTDGWIEAAEHFYHLA